MDPNFAFNLRVMIFVAEGFLISALFKSIRRNRARVNAALMGNKQVSMSTEERARLTRLESEIGKLLMQSVP